MASVVSFPNKYIQQRLMTSEGRVSTQNLYGNLTGVHNRHNTAIGSGSNSVHHSKGDSRDDELNTKSYLQSELVDSESGKETSLAALD